MRAYKSLPLASSSIGKHWRQLCLILTLLLAMGCGLKAAYMPVKAEVAQYLLMRSWQQAQQGLINETASTQANGQTTYLLEPNPTLVRGVAPWPWADASPIMELQIGTRSWLVMDQSHGEALAFGPGMVAGSYLPGSGGETVIAGHRDTHFEPLQQVKDGQRLALTRLDGKTFRYQVVSRSVINSELQDLPVDKLQNGLILVTCYPFNQATQGPLRYVIKAKLVATFHPT